MMKDVEFNLVTNSADLRTAGGSTGELAVRGMKPKTEMQFPRLGRERGV